MVTLGLGMVAGIAIFALIQLGLLFVDIRLNVRELALIGGGIIVLAALVGMLMKARRMPRGEKLTETIENVASFLGK
jgi:O-antigen ligase